MNRNELARYWDDLKGISSRLQEDVTQSGIQDHDEALEITKNAAIAIGALIRVIDFQDELRDNDGSVSAVAKAFADEIDRALKGLR
jgi:hypothetical protein